MFVTGFGATLLITGRGYTVTGYVNVVTQFAPGPGDPGVAPAFVTVSVRLNEAQFAGLPHDDTLRLAPLRAPVVVPAGAAVTSQR